VHTPGHASNHICFDFGAERALFSGDHVMGWSTTVVTPPDGGMAAYMASLARLQARADAIFWPTHGGPIRDPASHLAELVAHRRGRRAAVLAALGDRPLAPAEIVPGIYKDLDPRLVGAAAQSVLAHLIELEGEGLARQDGGRWRR
jgi:glyoxylase-like metal-dependent hydrolase (beta-lactamase superfamily II)